MTQTRPQEKLDREESANHLQRQSSVSEEERAKLKKEEKLLREAIAKLESSQTALTKNVQVVGDRVDNFYEPIIPNCRKIMPERCLKNTRFSNPPKLQFGTVSYK
jgi:hypothetical protein